MKLLSIEYDYKMASLQAAIACKNPTFFVSNVLLQPLLAKRKILTLKILQ